MKSGLAILFLLIFVANTYSQINLDNTGTYTQDFNTLGNSGGPFGWEDNVTLPGWYLQMANTPTLNYTVSYGQNSTARAYSFGTFGSAERALGSIAGNSTGAIAYGIKLHNTTSQTITTVTLSFTAELWRDASQPQQTLYFGYKTTALDLSSLTPSTTNGWTSIPALDFTLNTAGTGTVNGNSAANRTVFSNYSLGVTIPPGEYLWLRWWDPYDVAINNNGLAIDDVTITWGFALPVELQSFTAIPINNTVKLQWETATEIENLKFELERKNNSSLKSEYVKIAELAGAGNSYIPNKYTFLDNELPSGSYEYRLKQIDFSGRSKYLKTISATIKQSESESIISVFPNPVRNNVTFLLNNGLQNTEYTITVYNTVGECCYSISATSSNQGVISEQIYSKKLNSGVYYFSAVPKENLSKRITGKFIVIK